MAFTVTRTLLLATEAGDAQMALEVNTHHTESVLDKVVIP
jgi:hypothetical protein